MKYKIALSALLVLLFASCSTMPRSMAVVVVENIDRRPGTNEAIYHLRIVKDLSGSFRGQKMIPARTVGDTTNKIFRDLLQASRRFDKEIVCHMVEGRGGSSLYTIFNVERGSEQSKYTPQKPLDY